MAESTESVPLHPVAPRLKDGPKIPHLGPDIDAYGAAHALTIAENSDEWWAKVCTTSYLSASSLLTRLFIDCARDLALGSSLPKCQSWRI